MKRFQFWYHADGLHYMTTWPAESKEIAVNEFWEWAMQEYNVVGVDLIEVVEDK